MYRNLGNTQWCFSRLKLPVESGDQTSEEISPEQQRGKTQAERERIKEGQKQAARRVLLPVIISAILQG